MRVLHAEAGLETLGLSLHPILWMLPVSLRIWARS